MIVLNELKTTDAVSDLPSFINAEMAKLATAINTQSTILNDSSKTLNLTGADINSPETGSVYAGGAVNAPKLSIDGGKLSIESGGVFTKINNVAVPVQTGITSTDTDTQKLNKLIDALKSIGLISVS
jgi:hypothetical protein